MHARPVTLLVTAMLMAGTAAAQALIRMNPGQGATLFNVGGTPQADVSLRQPGPARGLTADAAGLCCPAAGSDIRCESSRGVPLVALASTVRSRHGTPASSSATEMRYAGIVFALAGAPPRVSRICVVAP